MCINIDYFLQVGKMCFMLICLSFMAATWILKYDFISTYINGDNQMQGRKQLIDSASIDAVEEVDMHNTTRTA